MNFNLDKKFVKLGRSWAMIIPPWFLKILEIDPEQDEMSISIEKKRIIIEKKSNKK